MEVTDSKKEFRVSANPVIALNLGGNVIVEILESEKRDAITIKTGSFPKDSQPSVRLEGNTLKVSALAQGSTSQYNMVIGGNMSIGNMSGGSISMNRGTVSIQQINGEIHISGKPKRILLNGKELKPGGDSSSVEEELKDPEIKLYVPNGTSLEGQLKGACQITSRSKLDSIDVDTQGSSYLYLVGKSLRFNGAGSTEAKFVIEGGSIDINCAGSGDIQVSGEWTSARLQAAGSGDIRTTGKCLGDYDATAAGSADIVHKGTVGGRVRKRSSGSASIVA